jgi:hypothetical protein
MIPETGTSQTFPPGFANRMASRIDASKNGNKIESSNILSNIHVYGITANSKDDSNATLLPNFSLAI